MKTEVSCTIEKETNDVGLALVGLVKAIKEKKSLTDIYQSEMPLLVQAVEGIGEIPAEFSDSKGAFLRALLLPLTDLADILAPAPVVVPVTPPPAA